MFHRFIPFHFVSLQAYFKLFGLFHPVSEFSLYILIVSFVTKQEWVYTKKKMYVSSFHSVSPCFVTSFEQVFCTVTSCFRVFLYILFVSFVT